MKQFIGCDAHKKYSVFVGVDETGKASRATRAQYANGEFDEYLRKLPPGTPVAVETTGHWYWLLDAIEAAGMEPHLAHALAAKRMMTGSNKTDKLDAKALATMLRNGTLPEVWVPGGRVRDLRGLMRSRLAVRRIGTALKNRILAALGRYGLPKQFSGDVFGSGAAAVQCLEHSLAALPVHTKFATREEIELLRQVETHVEALTERIRNSIGKLGWVRHRVGPRISPTPGRVCRRYGDPGHESL